MKDPIRALSCVLVTSLSVHGIAVGQNALRIHEGTEDYGGFGYSLAVLGDLDGDGFSEYASASIREGQVHVFSGADGSELFLLLPAASTGNWLFKEVAAAGDFNGDGVPDIAIGSLSADNQGTSSGSVEVRSGSDGSLIHAFFGQAGSLFGSAIDGGADVDGDGHADLIVGRPADNYFGVHNSGSARVFSGATLQQLHVVGGESDGDAWGTTVAMLDDLDGDGKAEFAVGSTTVDTPGVSNRGRVRVYSGATGAVLWTLEGTHEQSGFGWDIDGSGDVDADGTRDLIVGAARMGPSGEGMAFVYSGASGQLLHSFVGAWPGDAFGTSVAGGVDLDGDGHDDVAVGAWQMSYGYVYSGATGARISTIQDVPGGQARGCVLVLMEDVNGDGIGEVVAGFPDQQPVPAGITPPTGEVRVFSGAPVDVTTGADFCAGIGGAPCPCSNPGVSGAGCANSSGLAAELSAFGPRSVAREGLYFVARGLPDSSAAAVLFVGDQQLNGGAGLPMADGLRCVGTNLRRVGSTQTTIGNAWWTPEVVATGGWVPGETRYFQAWYRDPAGPCGAGSNLTQGIEIVFTP